MVLRSRASRARKRGRRQIIIRLCGLSSGLTYNRRNRANGLSYAEGFTSEQESGPDVHAPLFPAPCSLVHSSHVPVLPQEASVLVWMVERVGYALIHVRGWMVGAN